MEYVNSAKLFHLSSFADEPQLASQNLLAQKLSPQVRLSFAPGSLYAGLGIEALENILRRTDILFVNRDEIEVLTGEDLPEGARRCLEAGCKTVVVTLGGKSSSLSSSGRPLAAYVAHGDEEHLIEAKAVPDLPLVDSTGAGDAFAAGFLYGMLKEKPLPACGALGHVVALFCLSRLGARDGLPTLQELSEKYQRSYGPFPPFSL